ncbi:MAG: 4'-phosphopantetheinyl transferase superfamily protein [Azospirillaceae bacterium]
MPPLPPELADLAGVGTVVIHEADLAAPGAGEAEDRALLDDAEAERADRFAFRHLTRRFVAKRAILRRCLASRLGLAPETIAFTKGARDKPAIDPACLAGADPAAARLRFNLSDTGDRLAVALTLDREVGIDIEEPRDRTEPDALARGVMTEEEYAAWAALSDDAARQAAFFRLWTRKEAVMKALGAGLGLPPRRFAVGIAPYGVEGGRVPAPERLPEGLAAPEGSIRLVDLDLPDGLPGAVALVDALPRPVSAPGR